ncbi:hypothetical protein [Pseudooceanicola sp.]|uniref:hypothetical protein n=1 Tax=Pseudooceanicola sp. TaxID=1914328 RepID=UPI0040595DCE
MLDDRAANLIEEPEIDASACRCLWLNVLLYQWHLSLGGTPAFNRGRPEARAAEERAARAWFGTRDFAMVCALAGLEPRAVWDRWIEQQTRGRRS